MLLPAPKTYKWPTAQEKTLNIISQLGNANPNHHERPPHTYEDGCNFLQHENNKCRLGCGETGALAHSRSVWPPSPEVTHQTIPRPSCLTPRSIYRRTQGRDLNRYLYNNVHENFIHTSQNVEATQVPNKG